jgi:hypothetical protein
MFDNFAIVEIYISILVNKRWLIITNIIKWLMSVGRVYGDRRLTTLKL